MFLAEPIPGGRLRQIVKLALYHLRARPLMKERLARFKDPYQVLI